jgi:hypothetical protein
MSIKRYSDRSNDKTVMKGGGRDVAVGNPGMGFNTDVPQQLSLASPQRGSSIISVTQGSDEVFDERSKLFTNSDDIFNFHIDAPAGTDRVLFVADREMRLTSAKGGSNYAALLKKADSGTAIGSGTAIAASAAIGSTADNNANITAAPVTAEAVISEGQAVGIDFSGTTGSAANLTVTLTFRRVIEPTRRHLSTTSDE